MSRTAIKDPDYCAADMIVPISMIKRKKYKRVFNQAVLLAERVFEALDIPLKKILVKNIEISSQTK